MGTFNIGTTRIYSAVFEEFCPTVIECDTTYYLTNPEFPVYIDAFLTGIDGVACVGCEVDDEQNLLTEDNTDYATITIVADVVGSGSIAVADALYTYPAGTFAGFVIEDLGFLLEAELFEVLTISTYNNGVFQESRTGVDLIDLAVFILFISADEGRYNVGFETTLPFDEIRITVGSLVTAINVVRVYAAFVDTRASDGGSLACVDGPNAENDYAVTDEDTPVIIDVLSNDTDDESPIGEPNLEDEPSHGSAVLNPDSTFTYTPDDNFVGLDTFSYSICNDDSPALCDEALVIVTVNPVIDTIEETIPEDSTLTVCAENLTTFNSPATSLSVCDQPTNGTATSMGDCVTYTPDPGFNGMDTFCVVTCHPDIPSMCDTTIVIVTVTPVDAPPNAVDDFAVTDEDVPVTIEVLANDSDPDSELGFPTIVEPPGHGFVVVNLDSTITYHPNPNFVGVDTFYYRICDDTEPPLCDTAAVVITVLPERDTLTEIISVDSLLELCVSAWVEFEEPDIVSVCGIPEHGMITVIDTCFEYLPDPGYNGEDTICVIACDVNEICDTTIFVVIIELPLPLKWLSFDVYSEESSAKLKWTTTNEFNNAGFEIERSVDGLNFMKIGETPPNEPPSVAVLNSYQFMDESPSRGINYYRIRQNDRDGYYHYSPVKSLRFHDEGKEFNIWPNPSSGLFHLELFNQDQESIVIKLIDTKGQLIYNEKCDQCGDVYELDFNSIGGGIYMLILESSSGQYVRKITIMK